MSVLAESHWDKVDGIVFSDRCYLVEGEVCSCTVVVMRLTRYLCKKEIKKSKLKCVQSVKEQSKATENRCQLQWDSVPNFCQLFCMSKSPTPLTGGSRDRCCAQGCVWSCSCNCSTNAQSAFVQLAASFGIKFMETSAKANINIENVSTDAFLLYLLSPWCKPAVWTVACPGGVQNSVGGYQKWVVKHLPAAQTLAGGASVAVGLRNRLWS